MQISRTVQCCVALGSSQCIPHPRLQQRNHLSVEAPTGAESFNLASPSHQSSCEIVSTTRSVYQYTLKPPLRRVNSFNAEYNRLLLVAMDAKVNLHICSVMLPNYCRPSRQGRHMLISLCDPRRLCVRLETQRLPANSTLRPLRTTHEHSLSRTRPPCAATARRRTRAWASSPRRSPTPTPRFCCSRPGTRRTIGVVLRCTSLAATPRPRRLTGLPLPPRSTSRTRGPCTTYNPGLSAGANSNAAVAEKTLCAEINRHSLLLKSVQTSA